MQDDRPTWLKPPAKLHLTQQEVHLWFADLVVSPAQLQQFSQSLSADEQQRAARFRFAEDRDRFIATRGILRQILGRYLSIPPQQVEFCYADRGKPALNQTVHATPLQFNLSHSHACALYAITATQAVGVDLEWLRPVTDLAGLTQRFFAAAEHQAIQALPAEQQTQAFFQVWTCKEAVLKATGSGLAELAAVEVAIADGAVRLVQASGGTWQVYSLTPAPNWVAAIALAPLDDPSDSWNFTFWQWCNPTELGEII
jgi:4'-phosphopantetheinyl transferase